MKSLMTSVALSVGLLSASGANAALVPALGGQVVNDTDLNVTWLSNANLTATNTFGLATGVNLGTDIYGYQSIIYSSGYMTWGGAVKWIAAMNAANYLGYHDWRLPTSDTCSGYGCTGSEMGHLFYNELGGAAFSSILTTHNANLAFFQNVHSDIYWSGTEYASIPGTALAFSTGSGGQGAQYRYNVLFALAVRTGQVTTTTSPVPVPAAAYLLGSGLIGLIGVARKKPGHTD